MKFCDGIYFHTYEAEGCFAMHTRLVIDKYLRLAKAEAQHFDTLMKDIGDVTDQQIITNWQKVKSNLSDCIAKITELQTSLKNSATGQTNLEEIYKQCMLIRATLIDHAKQIHDMVNQLLENNIPVIRKNVLSGLNDISKYKKHIKQLEEDNALDSFSGDFNKIDRTMRKHEENLRKTQAAIKKFKLIDYDKRFLLAQGQIMGETKLLGRQLNDQGTIDSRVAEYSAKLQEESETILADVRLILNNFTVAEALDSIKGISEQYAVAPEPVKASETEKTVRVADLPLSKLIDYRKRYTPKNDVQVLSALKEFMLNPNNLDNWHNSLSSSFWGGKKITVQGQQYKIPDRLALLVMKFNKDITKENEEALINSVSAIVEGKLAEIAREMQKIHKNIISQNLNLDTVAKNLLASMISSPPQHIAYARIYLAIQYGKSPLTVFDPQALKDFLTGKSNFLEPELATGKLSRKSPSDKS